ncbi:MAG: amidohydrolase [Chloroflexi bacterium]|nr:amidohydrolase [Chloroflexota bacterium]
MPHPFIIDFHVHTYQSREIGLRAMGDRGETEYAGTIEETLGVMAASGVSKAVMLSLVPVPEMREAALARLPEERRDAALDDIDRELIARIQRRNRWSLEVSREHPELISFVCVDPVMGPALMRSELVECFGSLGAAGVKLHPNIQRIYPNDECLFPIYETAQRLGRPVLSHCGSFSAGTDFAEPRFFAEVLAAFPRLTLVFAHMGQGHWEEAAKLAKAYPQVMFDCSAMISEAGREGKPTGYELASMMRAVGAARVLFGSDLPWFHPTPAIDNLLALDLTEAEKRLILGENAARLLAWG